MYRMQRWIVIGIVAAVIVVGAVYLLWPGETEAMPPMETPANEMAPPEPMMEPEPEPVAPEPPPPARTAQEPQAPRLPSLGNSDSFVRQQFGVDVASLLAGWLAQADLIYRTAAIIHNASQGKVSRSLLGFIRVPGRFMVRDEGGRKVIDAASYARYDAIVEAVTSTTPKRLIELFNLCEPLFVAALDELSVEDARPRLLLLAALDQVLNTPVLGGPVVVVEGRGPLYEFAAREMEARSALQKQLLRMGPENVSKLRNYARALRRELGR